GSYFVAERVCIVNADCDREGRFSIQTVECLGPCGTAPVLQVNDTYYERVTRSRCRHLIEALRRDEVPEPWRERGGDNEGPEKAAPFSQGAAGAPAPAGGTAAPARGDGGEGWWPKALPSPRQGRGPSPAGTTRATRSRSTATWACRARTRSTSTGRTAATRPPARPSRR